MTEVFRYVGIGKEDTFGSEASAVIYIDPTSCTLDVPAAPEIVVDGGMGRMARRKRPGYYACGGAVEYPADVASLTYLFRAVLDQYVFTDAGGEVGNIHEFYGGNQNELTSWTYRVGKDVFEHVFLGCVGNGLTLNVADGLMTASLDLVSKVDDTTTIKTYDDISAYLPDESEVAFYDTAVSINGVPSSTICKTLNLKINNSIDKKSGRGLASMYPYGFKTNGRRLIEAQMQLEFEDDTHLELFWGGEGPQTTGSTQFAVDIAIDSGDYGTIDICLPNALLTTIPTQAKGIDTIYQTITVRGLMGLDVELDDASTVNTDILVTVDNGVTTLA